MTVEWLRCLAAGGGALPPGRLLRRPAWSIADLKKCLAVAKRHAPLANRHAAIGLAFDAAIDGDDLIGRTFDLDDAVDQDLAAAVHRNEIGRAVALAGHHDDAAGLQRDVCDQRISDHDGRDRSGSLTSLA